MFSNRRNEKVLQGLLNVILDKPFKLRWLLLANECSMPMSKTYYIKRGWFNPRSYAVLITLSYTDYSHIIAIIKALDKKLSAALISINLLCD